MRYRDSIGVFDRALLKSPSDAVLLLRKAAFLTKNREVDLGLETVEQLLAQTLNHRDALLLKAELLTAKGRDDDARRIIGALPAQAGPPRMRRCGNGYGCSLAKASRATSGGLARFCRHRAGWRKPFSESRNGRREFPWRTPERCRTRLQAAWCRLHGASLTDVMFSEVDLSKATLRNARLEKGRWQKVHLSGADLEGARGSVQAIVSKFDGLWAPWADLPGFAFLGSGRGAVFAGSSLEGSGFSGSDLTDSDFSNANLSGANLDGANFNGTSLRKSDLRKATLKFAKLGGADLSDAVYDQATIWPDEFDPAAAGARKIAD